MHNVNRILAALCLSEHSKDVLDRSVDLAMAFDADLLLLNVVNIRDVEDVAAVESMGYDVHTEDYRRSVKEDRREQIMKALAKTPVAKERRRVLIRVGHPFEQILRAIEEEEVDLLVIGAKGRTNLPQLLVGSVAEKLFRHSPVTVVSVRDTRPNKA